MKRLGSLLGLCALAGVALTTATAGTDATRTICHRTSSKATPYVKIKVSGKLLQAYLKRPADIIPAPKGACPKTLLTPTSGGSVFQVSLAGEAEAPAGDPVGTGTATVRMRAGQAQVCYQLTAKDLPAGGRRAHPPRGRRGRRARWSSRSDTERGRRCQRLREHDAGAGQNDPRRSGLVLRQRAHERLPGRRDPRPAHRHVDGGLRHRLRPCNLKGTSEPNATGTAVLRHPQGRRDCLLPAARGERDAADGRGAHPPRRRGHERPGRRPVHRTWGGRQLEWLRDGDPALIDDILANPAGYYVNVHTKEHPAGAIRAQLG